jgi:hypothetical protein
MIQLTCKHANMQTRKHANMQTLPSIFVVVPPSATPLADFAVQLHTGLSNIFALLLIALHTGVISLSLHPMTQSTPHRMSL